MAPEQVTDSRSVDVRADIYSLGCTLFKLLTGKAPFATQEHATAYAKMTAHVSTPPPGLAEYCPNAPSKLVKLIDSMLAKEATSRPQTAREVAEQLREFTSGHDFTSLVAAADRAEPKPEKELTRTSAVPQAGSFFDRRVPFTWLIAAAFGGAALGFALGIIVKITYPDGTTVSHSAPKGSDVAIQSEDQLPDKDSQQPTTKNAESPTSIDESADLLGLVPLGSSNHGSTTPDLVPVKIDVQHANGRPAFGATVTFRMKGSEARPISVTGRTDLSPSGFNGRAFNRKLPYGNYEVTVTAPDGDFEWWSVRLDDVKLGFDSSYARKFIAPVRGKRASLKLQNAFAPAGLEGLRFGYVRPDSLREIWSPEPGEEDNWSAQFPMSGDGVTHSALLVDLKLTRKVWQPDGNQLTWEWKRRKEHYGDNLVLFDNGEARLLLDSDWGCDTVQTRPVKHYFELLDARMRDHRVQYCKFSGATSAKPLTLEFASGDLEIEATAIYGKANSDVIQGLGLDPKTAGDIWLGCHLPAKSAWVPRILNIPQWSRGEGHQNLAILSLTLADGEAKEIRVDPANH